MPRVRILNRGWTMPLSLKCMLDKLLYKGKISKEEHAALINKLNGHDRELKNKVINELLSKRSKEG